MAGHADRPAPALLAKAAQHVRELRDMAQRPGHGPIAPLLGCIEQAHLVADWDAFFLLHSLAATWPLILDAQGDADRQSQLLGLFHKQIDLNFENGRVRSPGLRAALDEAMRALQEAQRHMAPVARLITFDDDSGYIVYLVPGAGGSTRMFNPDGAPKIYETAAWALNGWLRQAGRSATDHRVAAHQQEATQASADVRAREADERARRVEHWFVLARAQEPDYGWSRLLERAQQLCKKARDELRIVYEVPATMEAFAQRQNDLRHREEELTLLTQHRARAFLKAKNGG